MKMLSTLAKKKLVIAALEDIKARDIQAIDVRAITAIFDWIIVASAESARQTKALARHVMDELKGGGSRIVGTEGGDSGDWILVDAGDVVAHVMQPAVRQYYNLEELWGEGKFDQLVNSSTPAPFSRKAREPAKPTAKPGAKVAPRARPKAAPRAKVAPKAKAAPKARPKAKAAPKARPKAKAAPKAKAKASVVARRRAKSPARKRPA